MTAHKISGPLRENVGHNFPTIHWDRRTMGSTKVKVGVMDIVCGRGKGYDNFPGNIEFRRIIKEHAAAYSATQITRTEKSIIIRIIAKELLLNNIRFLKWKSDQGWVVLSDYQVNLKVRNESRTDIEVTLATRQLVATNITNYSLTRIQMLHLSADWPCPSRCRMCASKTRDWQHRWNQRPGQLCKGSPRHSSISWW